MRRAPGRAGGEASRGVARRATARLLPGRPPGRLRTGRRDAALGVDARAGRNADRARVAGAAAALALLAACQPWHCDFESHGACIEFTTNPPDLAAAQVRVDALLERELPFWGLSHLSGWRIQFRDGANYPCYFASESAGCTDYIEHTMSVEIPPTSNGCFEASELLHELGHYALGDPMHSNGLWHGVEPAFAPMVWEYAGAPAECVARYKGITSGMWVVNFNSF